MSGPMRIDEQLVQEAESQKPFSNRSVPKQIEHWARLGKEVDAVLNGREQEALLSGLAEIALREKNSAPVEFDSVFSEIEKDRVLGLLGAKLTKADVWYEASDEHPGYLEEVTSEGKRRVGTFSNGKFKAVKL